ncbi:kinase-like domain-containing protein [Trametes polyzona]|nr:kinase-like domain-containing protein [Trametes polyzona]
MGDTWELWSVDSGDRDNEHIESYSVCGIYQITNSIGEGQGGFIMRGFTINTGCEVALKAEPRTNVDESCLPQLWLEAAMYALIPNGTIGFPKIHYAGRDANDYVAIMDRLGPDLGSLGRFCRGKFTIRMIWILADQMLERICYIHSRGLVNCDIKPHNFAMGLSGSTAKTVHILDLGLARTYINAANGEHITFQDGGRHAIGAVRYANVAAHKYRLVSRRDDVESLLYALLEMYCPTAHSPENPSPPLGHPRNEGRSVARRCPPTAPRALSARPRGGYHAHVVGLEYGQDPDDWLLSRLFRGRMCEEGWTCDDM